jgi:hypothetical protein
MLGDWLGLCSDYEYRHIQFEVELIGLFPDATWYQLAWTTEEGYSGYATVTWSPPTFCQISYSFSGDGWSCYAYREIDIPLAYPLDTGFLVAESHPIPDQECYVRLAAG